jgi:hypothetical protein
MLRKRRNRYHVLQSPRKDRDQQHVSRLRTCDQEGRELALVRTALIDILDGYVRQTSS